MNAYDDSEYKKWRRECDELIFAKCNFDKVTSTEKLDNGYYIKNYLVQGRFENDLDLAERSGSISKLYNAKDELIYEWKCTYYNSRFSNIIHHSNNKDYLIFTEDLYGYSVLELDTLKSIHYVPKVSFYKNEGFVETFIWCDFHYNKDNDYLVVGGCLWGYPDSIILVDFSKPLEIQDESKWIDVHNYVDQHYNKYDDIEFIKWDGNKLVCMGESSKKNNIIISLDELKK